MLDTFENIFNLEGKVALVTGGSGDIGKAIAGALAAHGATVVIGGRSITKSEEVATTIRADGGKAFGSEIDIVDIDQVKQFVPDLVSQHNGLDILVNCVGTQIETAAEDYAEDEWDHIFSVNLKSAFFLSQAVAKVQILKGGGKQIHLSSVRSQIGISRGYVGYCASKGGLNLMIKQLATEWGTHNICVNGIAPTFTRTELVRPYLDDPDFYNPLVARIPLGRIAEPMDLVGLAVFLSARAGDFITGQIIFADGGVTASQ
ncbi:SDR family oxidoreductase [Rhodobacteraceae bacterium Araon29]